MKLKIFALSLVAIFALGGCDKKEESSTQSSTQEVKKEQKTVFKLDTIDNKKVTLKVLDNAISIQEPEYKDKVILVNFFATWCPPCRAEIPHLINLRNKYKDKFEVVAVMLDDGLALEEKKEFVNKFKINYTVTINQNENHSLANTIGNVRSIPYMMLFAPNGKFVVDYKGAMPEEMIDSDIQKALEIK
jgi:thiol-disulfide isomerase/thioredoxin